MQPYATRIALVFLFVLVASWAGACYYDNDGNPIVVVVGPSGPSGVSSDPHEMVNILADLRVSGAHKVRLGVGTSSIDDPDAGGEIVFGSNGPNQDPAPGKVPPSNISRRSRATPPTRSRSPDGSLRRSMRCMFAPPAPISPATSSSAEIFPCAEPRISSTTTPSIPTA